MSIFRLIFLVFFGACISDVVLRLGIHWHFLAGFFGAFVFVRILKRGIKDL
ncbi:hypothetical protein [Helicobacter mesocricetorum]|uniref:hypothetical protein n=1 Tax=Helicobacter mesocricetorum TaxID=87012 RepID=UPI001315523B|nr:hypothetical protein [Helicobacter mesocricetorum]